MNIKKTSTITFKSYWEREAAMREQRELERKQKEAERLKREAELIAKIDKYPPLNDEMSTKVAGFLSKFVCSIQNASDLEVRDFFENEDSAQSKNIHSEECLKECKEFGKKVMGLNSLKDPVNALIVANRISRFVPKSGILSEEQQRTHVDGVKNILSTIIRQANLDGFDTEDKAAIIKMVQKIENSDGLYFGIEAELQALIDKLNKKFKAKFDIGFIPPVQVRNLNVSVANNMVRKVIK